MEFHHFMFHTVLLTFTFIALSMMHVDGCELSYIKYCVHNVNNFLEIYSQGGKSCEQKCELALCALEKQCDCSWFEDKIGYIYMYMWKNNVDETYYGGHKLNINQMGSNFLWYAADKLEEIYGSRIGPTLILIGNSKYWLNGFDLSKKYNRCQCSKYQRLNKC